MWHEEWLPLSQKLQQIIMNKLKHNPKNAHINQHIVGHKTCKTYSNEIAFITWENLFRHEIKTKLSCRFDLYLWNHNSFAAHASTPFKTFVP